MEETKHTPLVSVIVPACNAEGFIEEAMMSVLNQSVRDLELIVIEDGSIDGTREVIRRIADQDPRVRVTVNEENLGVAKSRNLGMDLSRGQYIAFLDSDDYWHQDFLEKMIARGEQTGADIVYCSYAMVDEKGSKVCNDFMVPEQASYEYSLIRSVITCSTVLLTSQIAEGYRFPYDVYHEDIALWFRMLKEGAKAYGVTEILAAYRQRSGSRSSGKVKSAIRRWAVYRHLDICGPKCLWLMFRYSVYGMKKYRRI